MLCELSSTETYKSRGLEEDEEVQAPCKSIFFKVWLNRPIFKILLVVHISIPEMEIFGERLLQVFG
jgi:hypothetical protein